MTSLTASSVNIQTTSQAVPSTPSWFGEITVIAHHLQRQDVLTESVAIHPWSLMPGMNRHIRSRAQIEQSIFLK